MMGFAWEGPETAPPPPADGWCVRDAVCELFEWPVGSEEWRSFIQGPDGPDVDRLLAHLGLEDVEAADGEGDVEVPEEWLDHPGLAFYAFPSARMSHVIYEAHLRREKGLHPAAPYPPDRVRYRVAVDRTQAPG